MNYSHNDYKVLLKNLYPNELDKNWRYGQKHENINGYMGYDLVCEDKTITIIETPKGLQLYDPNNFDNPLYHQYEEYLNKEVSFSTFLKEMGGYENYLKKKKEENAIEKRNNYVARHYDTEDYFSDENNLYEGKKNPHHTYHLDKNFDKFKHVLHYGMDLDYRKMRNDETLYHFSQQLDFKNLVVENKTLLDYTMLYVSGMVLVINEMMGDALIDACYKRNHCDSIADLYDILSRVKDAYIANNMPLITHQSYIKDIIKPLEQIVAKLKEVNYTPSSYDVLTESKQKALKEIRQLKHLILNLEPISEKQDKKTIASKLK